MSKFEPRIVTLADGRAVTLREPEESDASAMLEYMSVMCGETDQLGRSAGNPPITLEQELTWIRNCHTARHFMLIGEDDGRIVASGGAGLTTRLKESHRAELGISVIRKYQNQGLGTAIVRHTIEWARAHPGVMKIWLSVFHNNPAAIGLYRKCGFIEEARIPRHYRSSDGRWLDAVVMGLWVKSV